MATYVPRVFDSESSTLQVQLRNALPVTADRLTARRFAGCPAVWLLLVDGPEGGPGASMCTFGHRWA